MTLFARLQTEFDANWTTVLLGWCGVSGSPPLLQRDDIDAFATERLALCLGDPEEEIVIKLLAMDLENEPREAIQQFLTQLSTIGTGSFPLEQRKWRLILLEECLDSISEDAFDGMLALLEFWNMFDFPVDMPHELHAIEDPAILRVYYQARNFERLLGRHRTWIRQEKTAISGAEGHMD